MKTRLGGVDVQRTDGVTDKVRGGKQVMVRCGEMKGEHKITAQNKTPKM